MRQLGVLLWVAGGALAAYAMFVFDPSVAVGRYGIGRVVNQDLQQRQLMMMVAGCALFIVGAVLHGIAASRGEGEGSRPLWQAYKDEVARLDPNNRPPATRIAYARQLGVREEGEAFTFDGVTFASIDEAVAKAEARKTETAGASTASA